MVLVMTIALVEELNLKEEEEESMMVYESQNLIRLEILKI